MEWDYGMKDEVKSSGSGVLIVCEGNFQYGNASISYYDPSDGSVENEVFYRANGMKLGDVAQSATVYDSKAWLVVNNSHVVFAIDTHTFREKGRIEGAGQPRYIHFVDSHKAYISQIWDNHIIIADPSTYTVTGSIEIPWMEASTGSTEQMVQIGQYVYCTCWSYQNCLIKIDSSTDRVIARLTVGVQPNSLVADAHGQLWALCDGGAYAGSLSGTSEPMLVCVDPDSFSVKRILSMDKDSSPRGLCTDSTGSVLYWISDDVWRMNIDDKELPSSPFIPYRSTTYYALGVDYSDGDLYLADAIDYQQAGKIYRYSSTGILAAEFYAGITPGYFCFF